MSRGDPLMPGDGMAGLLILIAMFVAIVMHKHFPANVNAFLGRNMWWIAGLLGALAGDLTTQHPYAFYLFGIPSAFIGWLFIGPIFAEERN